MVVDDPLSGLKDLRKDIYETLTFRNGCIYCHTLHGVGAESHHVTATADTPHGGLALPLEAYPAEVWKSFIFDQTAVAKKIGASPNPVAEGTRQAFYELVNKSRQAQTQKK